MDAVVSNNETLVDALALRIRTYKKDNPNLSGSQIAKKFNMAASSLNRIENGDVRVPSIDQVLKILRGTGASGDILKYLEANYPQIAETYRELYDTKNTVFVSEGLEEQLNNKDRFLIILLALTGNGTSRDEVLNEFGRRGLSELEDLLEKGLLVESDGIIGKNNEDLTIGIETIKKLLCYSIEECSKPGDALKGENSLFYKAVGVKDISVAKNIRKILKNANSQINEILNDESNLGDHKIFYGIVADSLLCNKNNLNTGSIQ